MPFALVQHQRTRKSFQYMRVLVVGGGAREHALVARLAGRPRRRRARLRPWEPRDRRARPHRRRSTCHGPTRSLALAEREQIDLTVVGPELPLSLGVADALPPPAGSSVGPTAAAARLESSKAFAKAFMARHGVPTARFRTCDAADEALRCVRSGEFGFPVVLKADGLAAGKGVVIADDRAEAEAAVVAAMTERRFGAAGAGWSSRSVWPDPRCRSSSSATARARVPIGTAQDHKRIFDDDRGPNTGGMGAFAPSPLIDDALRDAGHARDRRAGDRGNGGRRASRFAASSTSV